MIGGRLIKVCGLRAADNVRAVAALPGVDLVGFIFHPASPRCVTDVPDVPLPDGVRRVGVFVDVPEEQIAATAHRYGLHLVQLHGHESPDMCHQGFPRHTRGGAQRHDALCHVRLPTLPLRHPHGLAWRLGAHVRLARVAGLCGPDTLPARWRTGARCPRRPQPLHPSPLSRLRPQQSLRTLPRRERRRGPAHVPATLRRRTPTRPNFPGLGEALTFFCLLFFHQGKAPTGARKFFPVLFQG